MIIEYSVEDLRNYYNDNFDINNEYEEIETVLSNDPKMGLFRHADAGYEDAIDNSKEWGVNIPMLEK